MQGMDTRPATTVVALLLATADHIEAHGLLFNRYQFSRDADGENGLPVCGCLLGTMRHHAGLPPNGAMNDLGHPLMAPALDALGKATLKERRELGGKRGPFGLIEWSDYHANLRAVTAAGYPTTVDRLGRGARVEKRCPVKRGFPYAHTKVISGLRRAAHSEIAKQYQ